MFVFTGRRTLRIESIDVSGRRDAHGIMAREVERPVAGIKFKNLDEYIKPLAKTGRNADKRSASLPPSKQGETLSRRQKATYALQGRWKTSYKRQLCIKTDQIHG